MADSAESNSVHESIDSCPDSPAPSIDAESGEENDSLLNSEREEDILSLPSRIDSIWAPRSWKRTLASPITRCSVDQSRTHWSISDHFPVTGAVSFNAVFGASSKAIRCGARRAHIGKLDIRHLKGAGLTVFTKNLTSGDEAIALREQISNHIHCTCHKEAVPTELPPPSSSTDPPGPKYTGPKEFIEQGGRSNEVQRCPHHCEVPDNPKQVISGLMSTWTNLLKNQCPDRKTVREKPKGYALKPPEHTKLYNEARGLRSNLRAGSPSPSDLGEAVTAYGELCATAEAAKITIPPKIPTPVLNDECPHAADLWSDRVDAALTEILRTCVAQERAAKRSTISQKINNRLIEHILSMEEGGSCSGFLRRAAFNGTTQSDHVQATLPKGGASTEPEEVLKEMHTTYQNWFAARKHGPGGSSGAGRPDIMELYEGLDGRIQQGSDKCVAYNITLKDLKDSRSTAPADTCPGPSGISVALLKLIPDIFLEDLCNILNLILQWGVMPECFDLGYIFPIPKKGTFTPENSRPISLLEVHMKLLTRIINRRLVFSLVDEGYFSEAQFGFHPGRSCPDAFHILLATIEDAAERNREIHICLVDLTKAFDSLSPESLQQAYKHAGLSNKSVKFLGAMDGTGKAQVLTPFGPTKEVDLKWGVRQGEVLSPLKFITWLNPWLEYAFKKFPNAGYLMEDGTRVLLLAYADDLAIITSNQEEMQELMSSLCDFLKFHGVTLSADEKVSKSKTKYISYNPQAKKSDPAPRIEISCYNRDSRKGDQKMAKKIILRSLGKSYIFVYLGGRLSLDLNWSKITDLASKGISRELNRLKKKNLTLSEAAAVASSVILGKAGYLLQLAQFPLSKLKKWDSALNGALLHKVGAALGASPSMLHADKKKGGMGIFTFSSLALQSGATELLVRLNSANTSGKVARCRFQAALRRCAHWHRADGTIPQNTKTNFSLYIILRLRRLGYTLIGPQNRELVEKHYGLDLTPNLLSTGRRVPPRSSMTSSAKRLTI